MPPLHEDTIARLAATRTIELTTTGRHSGRPARIEIWWFHFEQRFVITGTPGPRDWFANVLADPSVVVHTADGDFSGWAEPVGDAAFRHRFFTGSDAAWYRSQAELDLLVGEAPMVVVTFG